MGKIAAVVHAPLTYLDVDGSQSTIDPSWIFFENAQLIVGEGTPISEIPWMEGWLKFLARTGVIVAAPPDIQPTRPAMLLQARNPGSAGNNIEIDIIYDEPPDTFTLNVTQTDVYEDLTLETLPVVLGTAQTAGTRPGLVRVTEAPTALPKSQKGTLTGGDADNPGRFDVLDTAEGEAAGTAFTLEAREPGEEEIEIEIELTGQTFTLTATWTESVNDLDASKLETELNKFGYVLTATPPAEGYALPSSGKFHLRGGVDSTFASLAPAAKPT